MEQGLLEIQLATRCNVVATYVALAQNLPGVRVGRLPYCTLVTGKLPLSFCRFSAGFQCLDRHAADFLAREARAVGGLWAFTMPGDEPDDVGEVLRTAGFRWRHRLTNMAAKSAGQVWAELLPAVDRVDRLAVGAFMADQFFEDAQGAGQEVLSLATADSGLGIYACRDDSGIVAAMLLSDSPGAVGLYNLCVDRRHRHRGIGRAGLLHALGIAHAAGLPLVLQCRESLVPWYERSGCEKSGFTDAYFHAGHPNA